MSTVETNQRESSTETSTMKIRPARREDMSLVAEFVRSSADWYRPLVSEEDMSEHEVGKEWAKENFERRDFYIGESDGEAVGTISLQYFGDYAYLGYIYLSVEHCGKGYGQKLMKFAERKARDAGMKGMALIAHPDATWATRAYLKYGFEIRKTDESGVKEWQDGVLEPYYETDFQLYIYEFGDETPRRQGRNKDAETSDQPEEEASVVR